jgi:hypothetical protein
VRKFLIKLVVVLLPGDTCSTQMPVQVAEVQAINKGHTLPVLGAFMDVVEEVLI